MRILRNIVIGLIVLVVALAAGSYLLPRNVIVERMMVIDAPPEAVFPHVNSLQAATEWSPWISRDPEVQLAYSGPEAGVGNVLEWQSDHPQVGDGRQEIIESEANARVVSSLDFGSMGTATAWFDLAPDGAGTRIVWGLDADMGMSPIGRWMGLAMDRLVGGDYEAGLANLKALVEAG